MDEYKFATPEQAYNAALHEIKRAENSNLTYFNLRDYGLTKLPPEIRQLTGLTHLNLSNNKLEKLPQEIGELKKLKGLYLRENKLRTLPLEIWQLTDLEELYVWGNDLREFPSKVEMLEKLTQLRLSWNKLTELPLEIVNLENLTWLELSNNQLSELPPEIGKLKSLTRLQLNSNKLTKLPQGINLLTRLTELDLRFNPDLPIPSRTLEKSNEPQTILDYYFQVIAASRPLKQAKVILVGEGDVGKTSLVKRLVYGEFDPYEKPTKGIVITPWQIETNNSEINLRIWDFGGQEIMYATHQFFLTKRTLYLLVLNTRQSGAQNRLYYWLKIVASFGGDSPVIIVGNQSEQFPLDLNRRQLCEKYPNLRDFIETDCDTEKGIQDLKALIATYVADLSKDPFPESWFMVKEQLEELSRERNYVPYIEYQRLCQKAEITKERNQHDLIDFLHDLGIVFYYRDERYPTLAETHILKPEWVTNGVYKIITYHPLMEANGELDWATLREILTAPDYAEDKQRRFIVEMMEKFELCFEFEEDGQPKYLIPDLLPQKSPYLGEDEQWADALVFKYRYQDVLPSSILSRFILQMRHRIYKNTLWRTGILLTRASNLALVSADLDAGVIEIKIRGSGPTRRPFLAIIREHIEVINRGIAGLNAITMVPHPNEPEVLIDYQYLLDNEDKTEWVHPPRSSSRVNVKSVLNGYEEEHVRKERQKEEMRSRQEKGFRDIRDGILEKPKPSLAFGIFLLIVFVVIILAITFLNVPWYAILAGMALVLVIGAYVMLDRGKLSEQGFIATIKETLGQVKK